MLNWMQWSAVPMRATWSPMVSSTVEIRIGWLVIFVFFQPGWPGIWRLSTRFKVLMPFEPPQFLNPHMSGSHVDKSRVYPTTVTVNAVKPHGVCGIALFLLYTRFFSWCQGSHSSIKIKFNILHLTRWVDLPILKLADELEGKLEGNRVMTKKGSEDSMANEVGRMNSTLKDESCRFLSIACRADVLRIIPRHLSRPESVTARR